jgi:hypothetical protein
MNLIKEQVRHSRFGLGTILDQSDTMVEVRFDEPIVVKKFQYPSAFESFLVLLSPALKSTMDQELTQIRGQMETERIRKIETDRLHEEAVRALVSQRAAAKKAPKPRMIKPKKAAEAT